MPLSFIPRDLSQWDILLSTMVLISIIGMLKSLFHELLMFIFTDSLMILGNCRRFEKPWAARFDCAYDGIHVYSIIKILILLKEL